MHVAAFEYLLEEEPQGRHSHIHRARREFPFLQQVPLEPRVDPAIVRGRRLNLPREICFVPRKRLSLPQGRLTAEQKSAEGVVGLAVGKASEALRSERWSQQIGQAGNGDRRPEREGEVSRS